MSDSTPDTRALTGLVCDDDRVTRGVLTDLLTQRGVPVLAETDNAYDAIALIHRFSPDLVICDMALRAGSGSEVLEFLADIGSSCQIVVFTAFDATVEARSGLKVRVVAKPDFERLERALDAAIHESADGSGGADRRRGAPTVGRPRLRGSSGLDDPAEFYATLAEATGDDSLLAVPVSDEDRNPMTEALRHAVRAQDLIIHRKGHLVVLLIAGHEAAPASVTRRLAATHPAPAGAARSTTIDPSQSPTELLEALLQ